MNFICWYVSFDSSFTEFRRSSQALPEWGARLPGPGGTLWPFHWYQWHPATEVCHAPTQPQPIWGGARAAVGPDRAEGEKGEGQTTGTCDGEKRRPQDQQWGAIGQRRWPMCLQPFQWRVARRHKPIHLQLQTQVTHALFQLNQNNLIISGYFISTFWTLAGHSLSLWSKSSFGKRIDSTHVR